MKLHSSVLFEIVGYSWLNMLADGALVLNWRLNGSRRLPDQNVDVYSIRPSVQCRWRQRLSMTGVQFQCYFYVILLKWIIAYRKRLKFEFIIWCNFLFFFFFVVVVVVEMISETKYRMREITRGIFTTHLALELYKQSCKHSNWIHQGEWRVCVFVHFK